jgi:hypothetical protein
MIKYYNSNMIISFVILILCNFTSAQDVIFQPNHRSHSSGGSNRNEWSQFEYGFMNGLLKVNAQDSQDKTDCISEGTKLFNAWGPLLIRWVKERLATGESDE